MSVKGVEKKFKKLSWNHLENWAGSRILSRGENYFKNGKVSKLRITPKGLLARVSGGEQYVTLVAIKGSDRSVEINSECTCPYGFDCKHAVATVLAYSQAVKEGQDVPIAKSTDPDIQRIEADDYEEEEEIFEEMEDDFKPSVQSTSQKEIKDFLDGQTETSLKELVLSLAKKNPEIKSMLLDKARLSGGAIEKLVSAMRKEIANITSEPAWHNHWSNEGSFADFSRIKSTMSNLSAQGQYDAVIEITKELMSVANSYVETCDDEGDSGIQISECMDIGFEAVKKCGWTDYEKIIFALDATLKDEYEIFNGASKVLYSVRKKSDWSLVADELWKRLKDMPCSTEQKGKFSRDYKRDRLSDTLIFALGCSGREKEILPLCEREAPITDSWERYVDRLIKLKKHREARNAAEEGIKKLGSKYPGIVKSLREKIAKLAQKSGDFHSVLSIRQEEFLEYPSLNSYNALLRAAVKTKNKAEIRAWSLGYLETGKANAMGALKEPPKPDKRRSGSFPNYQVLIDIAEKEKDPDKIMHWYREVSNKKNNCFHGHVQVARAVGKKYPDTALEIWRNFAERQISFARPSAYEEAVRYLGKARDIYIKTGRKAEWASYLEKIRETNKRKTRLLQSLRGLTSEKLI